MYTTDATGIKMTKIRDSDIKKILMRIENPGRYAAGEYGSYSKPHSHEMLNIAVSYPDLYEIGMANNAVKILYNILNNCENISCDRVFAPAPDFEERLRNYSIPLFTLENRTPLSELDILGFSFGYELTATNILNILELGNIPLINSERGESSPVIIAGGPGITNPLPYGRFIDLFYIGEAEAEMVNIFSAVYNMKREGSSRTEIIEFIKGFSCIWAEDKKTPVKRAVWGGFGSGSSEAVLSHYPVPSVKSVQDHGVVEIMRGCPNGCRFCHAGIYYRPKREKDYQSIVNEIDDLVYNCGYREITLSSLSSGDYSSIIDTISHLNRRYSSLGVSFALPSLKINSFTLPVLSALKEVRKSGLTFAVETPDPDWQRSINKEVTLEQTVSIIREAKSSGWRVAKFYFMIGLPSAEGGDEADRILDFLLRVQDATGMNINVNVGTFVPKPHTPYQWSPQLHEEDALSQIYKIKNGIRGRNIKLGFHSPFMSFLEGIFSRGDEKAGDILLSAYKKGARLDAWEEYNDRKLWREVIEAQDWDVEEETCRERAVDEVLPWDSISMGLARKYLEAELDKSYNHELTDICEEECSHNCGICGKESGVINRGGIIEDDEISGESCSERTEGRFRVVFSFEKKGKQIYLGHLNVMRVFEKAFLRSRLDLNFSEGFNPKPRLEFAHPLSLGVESDGEIASVELSSETDPSFFVETLNRSLPDGFKVTRAVVYRINVGDKINSLMSLYAGTLYRIDSEKIEDIFNNISSYIDDNSLEEFASIEKRTGSALLTLKPGNKKGNLIKILKEVLKTEYPLAETEVTVLENYASDMNGDIVDFLDFYS